MVIRPAEVKDAEGIAHVHVGTWQSTYRGIVPDSVLDDLSVERRTQRWQTTLGDSTDVYHKTIVAEMDGRIVGFTSFGTARDGDETYRGELYAIYVLKEFQGQGIGQALIQTTAKGLLALGFSSMLLWVLEENHASRKFYERMGGIYLQDKMIEIGGVSLPEKAYIWRDLPALVRGKTEEW
jgi:GNAT superfamily N-acetyltransferase